MTDLGGMLRLMQNLKPLPQCRITCGVTIYSWLRHRPQPAIARDGSLAPMFGVPIVLDARMPRGRWSYTENGVEVQSGQVGDGERVWYLPAADRFVTTEFGLWIAVLDGPAD